MSATGTFAFGDLDSGNWGMADAAGRFWAMDTGATREFSEITEPAPQVEVAELDARRWRVTLWGGDNGFDVEFAALGDPVELPGGAEQLCRVTGTMTAGGTVVPIECLGQRGGWVGTLGDGALHRRIGAWLADDEAILARSQRAAAADIDTETLSVFLVEGEPPVATAVADPRLSTQYDAGGRHVRAGLELWVAEEDDYARRAAGEVVSATHTVIDGRRLDCAFVHWRMHGRDGAGIYEICRPA